jgi:hypothetical protein
VYKVNAYSSKETLFLKWSFYDDKTEASCFHQMKHEVPILKNLLLVAREEINFKCEFHFKYKNLGSIMMEEKHDIELQAHYLMEIMKYHFEGRPVVCINDL